MPKLTVLGSSGGFPQAAQPCNGFLLAWDGFRVVLDLGYNTLGGLLAIEPDADVDAVVITHEHPDHCIDLHGLFRMRYYAESSRPRLPLYCPRGVITRLQALEPAEDLREVFEVFELPGSHRVGPLELTGIELPHFVTNVGVRLEAAGASLAYTGDTGPDPQLGELGRDADLFIVEATDRPDEEDQASRNLMTAAEAGFWAQRAAAERLLLTHFWPGNDRAAGAQRAQEAFPGEVLIAEPGLEITFADS